MPTIQEVAAQREAEKLRRAGLNPDGSPMTEGAPPSAMRLGNVQIPNEDEGEDLTDTGLPEHADTPDDTGDDLELLGQEVQRVRQELAAANGRAAPSQQQAAEYQQLWAESERLRRQEEQARQEEIAALRQQLEERNNAFDPAELLTEEQRELIDPDLLNTIATLADKIAQRRIPQVDVKAEVLRVQQERMQQEVQDHRQKVLSDPGRGLHKLVEYAYDPKFIAWSEEEDNDINSVVNSLLEAKSTGEVDRYAKMVAKRLAKFADFKAGEKQPTDTRGSLGSHMRRSDSPRMTEAEVKTKLAEAKILSRSRDPKDQAKARQIINDIQ